MWAFLPMVSLLVRAIVGDSEIDDSALSDIRGIGSGSSDIIENRIGKPSIAVWKIWKGEPFKEGRHKKEIDPNTLTENNFQPSCICKKTRVPFDNWGGKRSKDYPRSNADSQTKRIEVTYDQYSRNTPTDGLNGSKRITKVGKLGWRTPFNSWGGKRVEKLSDREQFVLLLRNPDNIHVLDFIKDELPMGKNMINGNNGKHTIQMKNKISTMYGNWNGKHNPFYSIPFHIYNKTSKNNNIAEKEVTDVNDWFTSMSDKRADGDGRFKKHNENDQQKIMNVFDPWGGKRSSKAYTFRFGNEYFTAPTHAASSEKTSFPIGEHK